MQVSVVVPVFNGSSRLLRMAARSVLADSSGQLAELIIVDDASTDAAIRLTLRALAKADTRVVVLRNDRNEGPATSRNRGINAARFSWIGFLDADDVWLPGQFGRFAHMLAAHPTARWMATGHLLMRSTGVHQAAPRLAPDDAEGEARSLDNGSLDNGSLGSGSLGKGSLGKGSRGKDRLDKDSLGKDSLGNGVVVHQGRGLTEALLSNFWIHLGATLTERRLCDEVGGFAPGLTYYEDMHFMARLSTRTPLLYSETDGYGWRQHEAGLTANPRRLRASSVRMHAVAARDPWLRDFRRPIRWAHLSALKGLAMNNLLAGRRLAAAGFALRAWMVDPREWQALAFFLRICAAGREGAPGELDRYSRAERFAARLPGSKSAPVPGSIAASAAGSRAA